MAHTSWYVLNTFKQNIFHAHQNKKARHHHNKGFFKDINNKQIQKKNAGPLLNRKGELVTSDAAMTEILKTFLTCVFTCTVGPGLGNKNPGWCKHSPTDCRGRFGVGTLTGDTIKNPPKGVVRRPGWHCCEATLHNLWEASDIQGCPRKLAKD